MIIRHASAPERMLIMSIRLETDRIFDIGLMPPNRDPMGLRPGCTPPLATGALLFVGNLNLLWAVSVAQRKVSSRHF